MKKLSAVALIGLSLLCSPLALLAQTDGRAQTPPAEVAQAQPVQPETPVATDPPAPVPATQEPTPATTQVQPGPNAPSPAPKPVTTPAPTSPAPAQADAPTKPPISIDGSVEMGFAKEQADIEQLRAWLDPLFTGIGGTLIGILVTLGVQQLFKRRKKRGSKPCPQCKGTGRLKDSSGCATCKGTGMSEEDQDISAECARCKGEGSEPCPMCKGEGELNGVDCAKCAGSGAKKDDDGKELDCNLCRGEGELSITVKRPVPCPDCLA